MEKIYGANQRQDSLNKVGSSYYLYYGFGKDTEDAEHGYNYRHKFDHKPSAEEVKEVVLSAINEETRSRIINGLRFDGMKVNLTVENQLNYAMFKSRGRYPVVIKVEDDEGNDVVLSLTKERYAEFYMSVQGHISECVQSCWNEKAELDLSCYLA